MVLREPQPITPGELLHSPTFFYWNGKLHRILKRKRAIDGMYVKRISDGEITMISLSAYENTGPEKYAYPASSVEKILNRDMLWIKSLIKDCKLNIAIERKGRGPIHLSADDIIKIAEVLVERAYAHPKNKYVNQTRSISEVKAILNNEQLYFVRTKEGGYIPAYKETR